MTNQNGFIFGKLIGLILVLLIVILGIFASRQTQEESALYPMKVLGDQIEYYLTPTDTGKARLKLDKIAEESITVRKDAEKENFEKVADRSLGFNDDLTDVKSEVEKIKDTGKDVTDLNLTLKAVADAQLCALADIILKVNDPVIKEKINQNIQALTELAKSLN